MFKQMCMCCYVFLNDEFLLTWPHDFLMTSSYSLNNKIVNINLFLLQAQKIQRKADVIEQLEYLKPLNLLTSSS